MKRHVVRAMVLVLLFSVMFVTVANSEEVLLSVKDGVLHFNSLSVELAAVEKPVRVRKDADGAHLIVQTPQGEQVRCLIWVR